MTIAEKSTELGIDLAQIAVDSYKIMKCSNDGVFKCFCAGGQNQNIYIQDDSGNQVHDGYFRYDNAELAETSTLAEVQAEFKAYLDAQEFISMPIADVLEELV